MYDAWLGKMASCETLHPGPCPALTTSLTTASNYTQPETGYLVHETVDAMGVAGNGVIIQPAPYNLPQPSASFAYWPMYSRS